MKRIFKALSFWWGNLGKLRISKIRYYVCDYYEITHRIAEFQNNPRIRITSVSIARSSDSGGSGWKDRYAVMVSYDVWE